MHTATIWRCGAPICLTGLLFAGTIGWAQDQGDISTVTTAEVSEVTRGYLQDEIFSMKPVLGIVDFQDPSGSGHDSRFLVGISMDYNAAEMINQDLKRFYIGPSLGVLYSHFGSPNSNFFGTSPDTASPYGGGGANFVVIPTDLKLGFHPGPQFRISVHGGGNIIYRSIANSMNLAAPDLATSDSLWKYYPNVGADVEFGLGRNVALSLRPDWTITPSNDFFMATLGLGLTLG